MGFLTENVGGIKQFFYNVFRRPKLLLPLITLVIIIGGLIGVSVLVKQSQETRRYASGGFCPVYNGDSSDPANFAGYVPCDSPGETLQGTYEQVMNIRNDAPAITDPGNTQQLEAVKNQVGSANVSNGTIDGGTHGGQENVQACSGSSCNPTDQGNGAAVGGGNTVVNNTSGTGEGVTGGGTPNGAPIGGAETKCSPSEQKDCGGANQGYCVCGGSKEKLCKGDYFPLGGDCVPKGTVEKAAGKPGTDGTHCSSDGECGSGLACINRVCAQKQSADQNAPQVASERYGITDNICHLPGAGCISPEDWARGFAAARGDTKALDQLKTLNSKVFSQVTVDGGIVRTGQQNQQAQQSQQVGKDAPSEEAQRRRKEETARCSQTLHLCPMLDPSTLQIVGWVPANEAVFGTFAEAGLARQNLSIGNLFQEIDIGGQKYNAYNFDWQHLPADELIKRGGMTDPKELERIAQTAEKNKITTDANGRIVIDQKYDIEKFKKDNESFWDEQNKIQTAIIDSVSKKDDPKVFQRYLEGCRASDDPASPCNEKELWDYIKQNTHVELLPKETQNQIKGFADSSAKQYKDLLEAKHQAEIDVKQRQEQFKQAVTAYLSNGDEKGLITLCKKAQDEKNDCRNLNDALSLLTSSDGAKDILFSRQLTLAQETFLKSQNGDAIKKLCVQKYGVGEGDCLDSATALRKLNPEGAEKIITVVSQITSEQSAREKIIPAAQQYVATGGKDALALYQACLALNEEDKHVCDSTSDILQRYLGSEAKNDIIAQATDVKIKYEKVSGYAKILSDYDSLCPTYKTDGKICDNTKGSTIAEDVVNLQKQAKENIAPNNFSAIQAVLDAYKTNNLNNADLLNVCKDLQKQDGAISCSGSQTDVIKTLTAFALPGIEQHPSDLEQISGELWKTNKMQNLSLVEKAALALSPTIPDLYAGGPLGKYYSKQYADAMNDGRLDLKDFALGIDTISDPLGIRHNIVERAHSVFDDQAAAVWNGSTSFGTAALTISGRSINELTFGAFGKYVAENVNLNSVYDAKYGDQNTTFDAYKDRVLNTENILSAAKLGGVIVAEGAGVGSFLVAPAAVPIMLGGMNFALSTSQAATACDMREQYFTDGNCKLMSANMVVAGLSFGATTYLSEAQLAYQAASNALTVAETTGGEAAGALAAVNTAKTQFGIASATNVVSTLAEGGINVGFAVSSCSQGDVIGCGMSVGSSVLTLGRFGLQTTETAALLRGSVESAQDLANRQIANQWLGRGGNALAMTQASVTCGAVMLGQGGQEGLAQCGQALASLKGLGVEGEHALKTQGVDDAQAKLAAAENAASVLTQQKSVSDKVVWTEEQVNDFIAAQTEKNAAQSTQKLITNADNAITQARADLAELTAIKIDNGSQKTSKAQLDTAAETVRTTTASVERNIDNLRAAYEAASLAGDAVSMQKIREQLTALSSVAKELRATVADLAGNTTAPVTARAVQDELGRLSTLAGNATKFANNIDVNLSTTILIGREDLGREKTVPPPSKDSQDFNPESYGTEVSINAESIARKIIELDEAIDNQKYLVETADNSPEDGGQVSSLQKDLEQMIQQKEDLTKKLLALTTDRVSEEGIKGVGIAQSDGISDVEFSTALKRANSWDKLVEVLDNKGTVVFPSGEEFPYGAEYSSGELKYYLSEYQNGKISSQIFPKEFGLREAILRTQQVEANSYKAKIVAIKDVVLDTARKTIEKLPILGGTQQISLPNLEAQRPLFSNDINMERAEKWVESMLPANKKGAQAIIDNLQHVGQELFEQKLQQSVQSFNTYNDGKDYVVFIQEGKSNKWVYELVEQNLSHPPTEVVDDLGGQSASSRIAQAISSNSKIQQIVFFDDGIYSGEQMSRFVSEVKNKLDNPDIQFVIVAPYATEYGRERVIKAAKNVVFVDHEKMASVYDLVTDEDARSAIKRMYGYYDDDELKSRTLTYFDHKVADSLSTPNLQGLPFISNPIPPYKDGYKWHVLNKTPEEKRFSISKLNGVRIPEDNSLIINASGDSYYLTADDASKPVRLTIERDGKRINANPTGFIKLFQGDIIIQEGECLGCNYTSVFSLK